MKVCEIPKRVVSACVGRVDGVNTTTMISLIHSLPPLVYEWQASIILHPHSLMPSYSGSCLRCYGISDYHISFDRDGYMIEPIWIDETSNSVYPPKQDERGDHYETCLRLRLDKDALKNFSKLTLSLEQAFDQKLIIFLNKLQRMIFDDRYRQRWISHERVSLSTHWLCIRTTMGNNGILASVGNPGSSKSAGSAEFDESYWCVARLCFIPTVPRAKGGAVLSAGSVSRTEIKIGFRFRLSLLEIKGENHKSDETARGTLDPLVPGDASTNDCMPIDTVADHSHSEGHIAHVPSPGSTGNLGGETKATVTKVLKLDRSSPTLPIFAYLPTKTHIFPFLLQGDFVLATSRESILENSEWNLHLLNQIPELYERMLIEFSTWIWGDVNRRSANCPILCESFGFLNLDYSMSSRSIPLDLSVTDLQHLLPKLTAAASSSMLYVNLIKSVYSLLHKSEFLIDLHGNLRATNQFLYLNNLSFDVISMIPHELILEATGRYCLHPSVILDGELLSLLDIPVLTLDHIIACIELFARQISSQTSDLVVEESSLMRCAGLLLSLSLMVQNEQKPAGNNGKGGAITSSSISSAGENNNGISVGTKYAMPVPVQVKKHMWLKQGNALSGNSSDAKIISGASDKVHSTLHQRLTLKLTHISRLRQLSIWPSSSGKYTSLDTSVLLIFNEKSRQSFSPQQCECFEIFKSSLQMVHDSLFQCSEAYIAQGQIKLHSFMTEYFGVRSLSAFAKSSHGAANLFVGMSSSTADAKGSGSGAGGGGIEEMTPDNIIRDVILPFYRHASAEKVHGVTVAAPGDNLPPPISPAPIVKAECERELLAAYLAFIYLSRQSKLRSIKSRLTGQQSHSDPRFPLRGTSSSQGYGGPHGVDATLDKFLQTVEGGVLVPVLVAKDKHKYNSGSCIHWHPEASQLVRIGCGDAHPARDELSISRPTSSHVIGPPDHEVHLGIEFVHSATNRLCKCECSTVMRRERWMILDPLVSVLACGKYQLFKSQYPDYFSNSIGREGTASKGSEGAMDNDGVGSRPNHRGPRGWPHEALSSLLIQLLQLEDMESLQTFYFKLGVVNFFGVYDHPTTANSITGTTPSPVSTGLLGEPEISQKPVNAVNSYDEDQKGRLQAPALFRFINQMLKNGVNLNDRKKAPSSSDSLPVNMSGGRRSGDRWLLGTKFSPSGQWSPTSGTEVPCPFYTRFDEDAVLLVPRGVYEVMKVSEFDE